MRVAVVDWSGAAAVAPQRRHIWLAEADVERTELVALTAGHTRTELVEHLVARRADFGVIGLDFSFSFPAWFVDDVLGAPDAFAVWDAVAARGEQWLADCAPPFFGRRGTTRPAGRELLRAGERAVPGHPKSVFQLAGSGHVGTGSLRGMPHLTVLRAAGFAIWPFDDGPAPLVAEVFPTACTGRVADPRAWFAAQGFDPGPHAAAISSSDDAFDAAASALVLARWVAHHGRPGPVRHPLAALEGWVWHPGLTGSE